MSGSLTLCATPIGNLEDMSMRAIRALKEADLIAAEDTRNSIKLLNHFEISTPMTSYHEFNKFTKGPKLIEKLLAGENIVLITDAGTPGISDPGEHLVSLAKEAGVFVSAIPGACACITALIISGLPTGRFVFEAFLPTEKKERAKRLEELKTETRTMVLYEAPHRLVKTLAELLENFGDRKVSVCRELTKKHETVFTSTLSKALAYYEENPPKGECVFVLEGLSKKVLVEAKRQIWDEISIAEHMQKYLNEGMEKKDAMKQVAKDRGLSKRDIYQALLEESKTT